MHCVQLHSDRQLVSSECLSPVHFGEFMSFIKGLLKTAAAAKLIQVAQRELSKPENQQKIKDGLRRLQETTKSRR
jgi:hypothetical protein